MADICRAVRLAIQTRLSDATNGFNPKYAAIQDSYGVPDLSIDWSDATTNFAWGRVPPDLVEETSPFSYPLLTIDADRGQQAPVQQRIRFKQFSGQVLGWIDLHLSWIEEQVTDDIILLIFWRNHASAESFEGSVSLQDGAMLRRVRVVRDYGMYDREAPQYYLDAKDGRRSIPDDPLHYGGHSRRRRREIDSETGILLLHPLGDTNMPYLLDVAGRGPKVSRFTAWMIWRSGLSYCSKGSVAWPKRGSVIAATAMAAENSG